MGHIPAGHALRSRFSNWTPDGLRGRGSQGRSTTAASPTIQPKEPSSANCSGGALGKLLHESSASVSHLENKVGGTGEGITPPTLGGDPDEGAPWET